MKEARIARMLREMRSDGVAGFFERFFGLETAGGSDDQGGKSGGIQEIPVESDGDAVPDGR